MITPGDQFAVTTLNASCWQDYLHFVTQAPTAPAS